MVEYKCKYCKYDAKNKKDNYENHLKTKKHIENELKYFEEKNICGHCKKDLKFKSKIKEHNCEAKKEFLNCDNNLISMPGRDHIGDNIKDSYNKNYYTIIMDCYNKDTMKFIKQLISDNVIPFDSKESMNLLNHSFNYYIDTNVKPLIDKYIKVKESLTDDICCRADFAGQIKKEENIIFSEAKDVLNELDKLLNVNLQPKITNYHNYMDIVFRMRPDMMGYEEKNDYYNNFMNGDKKFNLKELNKAILNIVSTIIDDIYISGKNKYKSIAQTDDDIVIKSKDLPKKKLLKLSIRIMESLFTIEERHLNTFKIIDNDVFLDINLEELQDMLKNKLIQL